MSPFTDSNNPVGAGNEQPRYGQSIRVYAVTKTLTPTTVTLPVVGDIVVLTPWTTAATVGDWGGTRPTLAEAVKCPAASSNAIIGVCVGGTALGTNPAIGGVVMVCEEGIAQVLFGAGITVTTTTLPIGTTAGHWVLASTTVAGQAKDDATAVLGRTVGTILETKPITTATVTVLVTCYIHKI